MVDFPLLGSMCIFIYLFIVNAADENGFYVKTHKIERLVWEVDVSLLQHVPSYVL